MLAGKQVVTRNGSAPAGGGSLIALGLLVLLVIGVPIGLVIWVVASQAATQ